MAGKENIKGNKELSMMTKKELYKLAQKENIQGKSALSKEQLIEALEHNFRGGRAKGEHKPEREEKPQKAGKSEEEKRKELLHFLDKKAFEPIINASPNRLKNDKQKKLLEDVQSATKSTMKRYHEDYKSSQDVKDNFQSDLNSRAAKKVHKEIDKLGLPSLPMIRDEFMDLCNKLGVH